MRFVLLRGGVAGEIPLDDERRAEISTPQGTSIAVVGTRFFVIYDQETQITTVGNFGGTISAGAPAAQTEVPDGMYVVVGPEQTPGKPRPLPMSMESFVEQARALDSPLELVARMEAKATPSATQVPPTSTSTPSSTPTASVTPTPSPTPTQTPTPLAPWATFTTNGRCRRGRA